MDVFSKGPTLTYVFQTPKDNCMSITLEKKLNVTDKVNLGELAAYLPVDLPSINNPQTDIPNIAKDERLVRFK